MKLYYFDMYGRAEPIRQALWHAKVDFEDVRIDKEKFQKLKETEPDLFEFGQLPVMEDDGKKLCQTIAILRYVGNKHGYIPADAYQRYLIDSFFDAMGDLYQKMIKAHYAPTEEEKKQAGMELLSTHLPFFMGKFNDRIAANGHDGHVVGDKYTIADFGLGNFFASLVYNDAQPTGVMMRGVIEQFPHLVKFWESYKKDFADYLAKREPRPM